MFGRNGNEPQLTQPKHQANLASETPVPLLRRAGRSARAAAGIASLSLALAMPASGQSDTVPVDGLEEPSASSSSTPSPSGSGGGAAIEVPDDASGDDDPAMTSDPGPSGTNDDQEDSAGVSMPDPYPGSESGAGQEDASAPFPFDLPEPPQVGDIGPLDLDPELFAADDEESDLHALLAQRQTDPTGRFEAPTHVRIGTPVEITLLNPDSPDDYMLLTTSERDDNVGNYARSTNAIGGGPEITKRAHGVPGTYELRYYTSADRERVSTVPIEVIPAHVEVLAPERVTAGSRFDIFIIDPIAQGHVVVRDADIPEDDIVSRYSRMRYSLDIGDQHITRTAPSEPGLYEVRYHMVVGRRVGHPNGELMASAPIEVVPEDDDIASETAESLSEMEDYLSEIAEALDSADSHEEEVAVGHALANAGSFGLQVLFGMLADGAIEQEVGREMVAAAARGSVAAPTGQAAQAQTQAPAMAGTGGGPAAQLSRSDERAVISLLAGLPGTPEDQQQDIMDELASFGPAAADLVYEFMDEGLLERGLALRAITAIEHGTDAGQQADAPHQEQAEPQPTFFVVGVASDDALNVRAGPGVGNDVVGAIPFDATGVQWSGREATSDDGGLWYEIHHPGLGITGWTNSRFLQSADPGETEAGPTLAETTDPGLASELFVQDGDRQELEGTALTDALNLANPNDAVGPTADLTPLSLAVLALESNEAPLPRMRYRVRYGVTRVEATPGGAMGAMYLVEVDRYNLGPAIHDDIVAAGMPAGPIDEFGVGPHVSYRFAIMPMMGRQLNITAASRTELTGEAAAARACLDLGCLETGAVADSLDVGLAGMEPVDIGFSAPYSTVFRHDSVPGAVLSPAAALDRLLLKSEAAEVELLEGLNWTGFEHREGVQPGEPFVTAVIEVNLGQEAGIDAVMKEGAVMDHAVESVWRRIGAVPPNQFESIPSIYSAEAVVHRPGQN